MLCAAVRAPTDLSLIAWPACPPACIVYCLCAAFALPVSVFCSESPTDLSLTACLRRLVDPRSGKAPCRERLLAEVGNQVNSCWVVTLFTIVTLLQWLQGATAG
jgi:hypothetical protein